MVESLKMQGPAKRLLSVEIPGEFFLTLKVAVNDKFIQEGGTSRCIDSTMYFLEEVTIWILNTK